MRSQLLAQVPFAITTNDGQDLFVNTNIITLSGTGWIDVRDLEINGIPFQLTWTGTTSWSVTVPLISEANVLNLQGQVAIAYNLYRAWVSEYQALPDLDAGSMNTVGIQSITLQHEGWQRDTAVPEPTET